MSDTPALSFRTYRSADRAWVHATHLSHYTDVEGFDAEFDEAVTAALDHVDTHVDDPHTLYQIVEAQRQPAGCLFCCADGDSRCRLRLFYLSPGLRGHGLGSQMLDRAIHHARTSGAMDIKVSTYARHAAAVALYRRRGFFETAARPVRAFGQSLLQLDFRLPLT